LSAFLESQRQFESYLRHALNLGTTRGSSPDWMRLMFGQPPHGSKTPAAEKEGNTSRENSTEASQLRREVQELRQEIEVLRQPRQPATSRRRR
jgi:hypothetical protein